MGAIVLEPQYSSPSIPLLPTSPPLFFVSSLLHSFIQLPPPSSIPFLFLPVPLLPPSSNVSSLLSFSHIYHHTPVPHSLTFLASAPSLFFIHLPLSLLSPVQAVHLVQLLAHASHISFPRLPRLTCTASRAPQPTTPLAHADRLVPDTCIMFLLSSTRAARAECVSDTLGVITSVVFCPHQYPEMIIMKCDFLITPKYLFLKH